MRAVLTCLCLLSLLAPTASADERLTLAELRAIARVADAVDPARLVARVQALGVDFHLTEALAAELRKAGLTDAVLKAIHAASPEARPVSRAIGVGGGPGGTFGGRRGGRMNLARREGGSAATENAVQLGLAWLAKHQEKNGRWDSDGFMRHDPENDVCSGVAKLNWVDPGVTGLSLLAFLGAGHTHRYGKYKEVAKLAIRYLLTIQDAEGLIGARRGHFMYNHAVCTLALTEAYGMTRSPTLRPAVERALALLIRARNPGAAWRYTIRGGDSDVSVTGWCVMALKSAKAAGLTIAGLDQAMKDAATYIESVTDDSYYVTGYSKRPPRGWQGPTSSRFMAPELAVDTSRSHGANHTPTAIATMCRVFFGYPKNDPRLRGGAAVLARMLPEWRASEERNPIDCYYWYYGTLAMFQMGGDYWRTWNQALKRALVDRQRTQGSARGSWDPVGAWGFAGGRVYATAINVLSLEIYYRYARIFK